MAEQPAFKEIDAPAPPPEERQSIGETIAHYWHLLRRYYWVILVVCAVSMALAYLWTERQPRIYSASAKIVFHQSNGNVLGRNIEQVELLNPGGRWQFEQFWNTQKEVFETRSFARKIVQREGLVDEPGFVPPPPEGVERTEQERMDAAIDRVLEISRPQLMRESRVATLTVRSDDPELSARIATAMAEEYVSYTREFQSGGLERIVNWFDNYVNDKRDELAKAQSKLAEYKRDNNILSVSYEDRQNLTTSRMRTVSDQLTTVRRDLAVEEALLEQIDAMEADGVDLTAIAGLLENRLDAATPRTALRGAVARRDELKEQLARLRTRYMEGHPEVQETAQQLEVVNENIEQEIARSRDEIKNSVAALNRTEQKLQGELAVLKEEAFKLNELGVEYKQLQNKADNLEQLYETVLTRSSELDINSLYEPNDIEVLERAEVPEEPVSPNLPVNLAVGLAAGLIVGLGITVLIDSLDTTIKGEEDVAVYTDRPILAMLPALDSGVLRGLDTIGESPADTITHTAPKSSFAEGIKRLRTNLTFMSPDKPPRLMLVTSPGPSEGKTLTSVNMAIAMAQSGQKTLIIDSDMRRPRLHKALGVNNERGLSNAVRGEGNLDELVQETEVDNLYALTCGDIPPNPSELLHADRFAKLVDEMEQKFDRVIFDSPPLGAVSDALILSHSVDGVLLVAKFGKTRREMLGRSIEQLRGIGAPLMGLVLNHVSQSGPGYRYNYYYRYSYRERERNKRDNTRLAS